MAAHLSSYILTFRYADGEEDVHTIYAYSERQAKEVAWIWCDENRYGLVALEKGVNYAQAI